MRPLMSSLEIFCRTLSRLSPSSLADRKSTRLNSSHVSISYAVFCLKKKKKIRYLEGERDLLVESQFLVDQVTDDILFAPPDAPAHLVWCPHTIDDILVHHPIDAGRV